MKRPVLEYREQQKKINSHAVLPSITEFACDRLDDSTKEKVIDYMLNMPFTSWIEMCGPDTDAFTGEPQFTYSAQITDGTYVWFDNLAAYVYKYDVKLPDDFIEHVLEYYENGGEAHPYINWRTWWTAEKNWNSKNAR